MALLSAVANASGRPVEDLIKVWRQPSFSIANISSSGSSNKTIIPRKVRADISLRIVPDQVGSKKISTPLFLLCYGRMQFAIPLAQSPASS